MSLREQLAAKRRREAFYNVQVADPGELPEKVQAARQALRFAKLRDAPAEEVQEHEQRVAEAEDELRECYLRLRLVALPPTDLEALIMAHPATDEGADGDLNLDTFRPALIAACAVEAGMSAEEWAEEFASGRWSIGERNSLYETAMQVNADRPASLLPKG